MTDTWPWPQDDRLERRSRVARIYRDRLADLDATACAEIDDIMNAYGQTWIIDGPYIPPETLLTETQVAEYADVSRRTVQKWVERGHLERRLNADQQICYLMQDLIDYQAKRRTQ